MSDSIKDSDDTHWNTTYTDKDGQANDLCGKVDSPDHCHMWIEKDGGSGVIHRGECKVCDDEKSSDSSGSSKGDEGSGK